MNTQSNKILLFEKPLFSWYKIQTPIDEKIELPSQSCFAYIIEGEGQDLSKSGFLAKTGTIILSLCGKTVGRTISKTESGFLNCMIVHFDRDILKKVFNNEKPKFWKELIQPLKRDITQQDATALVSSYFLSISNFFDHQNALSDEILSIKLKEIVLLLLQSDENSDLNTIIRSLFSDKTFSFQEIIEANLYVPLDLNRLAGMTNNSLASFKRKFTKIYQVSPAKYIRQKKLEKAKSILASSQDSISDVCYDCGFTNPVSFSRLFKLAYNISPSDYRLSFNV
ncbi:helix-turn-helix domain-containing protein [Flammeovirga kamogawensis]|uniref:Helix-turn-helix transcriptional regulator n=1 Tax=Flammeovirga kamogawensis TaxID=373891 RepID=A0ABX8GYB4_9BACT|nr:AraC family transcriptional regulator [Flammeovirga kamogawensis]MBB6458990.1 AraC-like DNA-binding protein [Flammeovirga kamogawensis]QWG08565.1 helix-turn-helix transcriptional regulator [Flammeovirga kamogawensis]TRX66856.1 helix-turn-helix transcriptional regulator [Flammeovirga kamogawensis]